MSSVQSQVPIFGISGSGRADISRFQSGGLGRGETEGLLVGEACEGGGEEGSEGQVCVCVREKG